MKQLAEILTSFQPITLKEMDGVKLLERTDTKYAFRTENLITFLDKLRNYYRVLEVDNSRLIHYQSLYYDTDNFKLYHKHHSGKLNRFKIRYRRYVESGLTFFEIKDKTNKGRTCKNRVKCHQIDENICEKANQLLLLKTGLSNADLQAKLWVNFTRITLVSNDLPERLTIDTDLVFSDGSISKFIPHLVIAEVKLNRKQKSVFISLMKDQHIEEGSLSKYCYGVTQLHPGIKQNNFKEKINIINKLIHDSPSTGQ
ncbi:MAG: polyphosphate polymerase domain-containing protein [Bacteroidetes bacterium]|nr:polyphosphate polymerase domain-containing protein [Bacteroidota bacterium]